MPMPGKRACNSIHRLNCRSFTPFAGCRPLIANNCDNGLSHGCPRGIVLHQRVREVDADTIRTSLASVLVVDDQIGSQPLIDFGKRTDGGFLAQFAHDLGGWPLDRLAPDKG